MCNNPLKGKQCAISAFLVLDMDIIRQLVVFGVGSQSFQRTIRAKQGANQGLILYSRVGDKSMIRLGFELHACHNASIIATCVMLRYDIFSLSSVV